jgi:Lipocalin-like domain
MMRRNLLAVVVSSGLVMLFGLSSAAIQVGPPNRPSAATASLVPLKDQFVGTWKLVSIDQRSARGELVSPPAGSLASRTGYLIYDAAGYMAVSIMPVGRKKYAGPQPTDEEAKAAMTGYAAYFGTFTIDGAAGTVTHHLHGSLNPGMASEQKRSFEFAGNRLTLKPPAAANGNQSRLTWERMPDMPGLTTEYRRFLGFWRLVSNERRNENGEVVVSNPGQKGYIIYTTAGFMMVHMMQPNRNPYAGAQPTPEEARQTIRTYTNYFGPFYVHDSDGYVVHDQVGTLNLGRNGPSPQQRFYQFTGNRLVLKPPPTYTPDGHTIQGTITWERVEGDRGTR